MSWTASAVINMPNKMSKRTILIVSLLFLSAALINMMMFIYIEYVNAYKTATVYVDAQHSIFQKDLAKAVMTDDIYTLFTMVEDQAKALPYLDNIAIYDENRSYVADANVLRDNIVSDMRNVGIERKLLYRSKEVGTVIYFISRMAILEQIIMNVSGLLMLNIVIVITGALAGGYLSLRITRPVRALSEHLQEINAPEHRSLEYIKKNKSRGFRPKSENMPKNYATASIINFRTIKKRKA